LLSQRGVFQSLIEEFGSSNPGGTTSDEDDPVVGDSADVIQSRGTETSSTIATGEHKRESLGVKLILDEERVIGSMGSKTYLDYLRSIRSWWLVGSAVLAHVCWETTFVGNSVILGLWSGEGIAGFSMGEYMAVYAGALQDRHRCGTG
jgi:hypothetical protein